MNAETLLSSKEMNSSQLILKITAEEALEAILEMLDEYSMNIDFTKLSKEELEKLLSDYADAVINYHPDDYHQERATILKNETIFKRCGLTDEDIESLDFT